MSSIKPPPIYEPLTGDDSGIASLPWILYFNSLFTGDKGTAWTPTLTSLTTVGTPTITGRYYKLGSICYFSVKIVPATSTSSVAGTTYINNFPLTMNADGFCVAVSGLLGTTPGMCDQASNRVYVPAWSLVTVPLTVIGVVEAS